MLVFREIGYIFAIDFTCTQCGMNEKANLLFNFKLKPLML